MIMTQINKANTQLMARCFFNRSTGKVTFENLSRYYAPVSSKLFK